MSSAALKLEPNQSPTPKIAPPSGDSKPTLQWQNEVWGGLAAMLVALPSSIAFGILVYSNIKPSYSAQGAMAGLIGTCALGLINPFIGKTKGLISAPCAPSAAVLSALVVSMTAAATPAVFSGSPESIFVVIALVSLFSALLQILFGLIGGGNLIKFIPYQVVAGYLSGVGLLIGLSQLPKLLGLPKGLSLWNGLMSPEQWKWQGIVVGLSSIFAMIFAPKLSRRIPAPIFALGAGAAVYFLLGIFYPELLELEKNPLVIGPLAVNGSIFTNIANQFSLFAHIDFETIKFSLVPALTLAVLLSIDTLKTCVALDSLTRSRHNSNREIIGQGLGNVVCSLLGGIPGAGTMGATLVNISSGGQTPLAGVFEGVFTLLAILAIGPLMSWIPVASLAGILLIISYRMFDRTMFRLAATPAGRFDFAVIISVVITALTIDLIAASGVGVAFSIILFIRDQIRETVILQKTTLSQTSSKTLRSEDERSQLSKFGHQALVCKLQGNLFFGTTDQFSRTIEPDLKQARFLLLDMRKVHSLDYTAFHLLERIHEQLAEKNGNLLFSGMPSQLYKQRDFERYLSQLGLVNKANGVLVFETFDSALEWMEESILKEQGFNKNVAKKSLEINDFNLFRGFSPKELSHIQDCLQTKTIAPGELIFKQGDLGDELFLVRKGSFKALLPLAGGKYHHVATFETGSFFGELAFLDHDRRTADVIAKTEAEVFVFSRSGLNEHSITHPEVGAQVFARLASSIAQRLRTADAELRALEDH